MHILVYLKLTIQQSVSCCALFNITNYRKYYRAYSVMFFVYTLVQYLLACPLWPSGLSHRPRCTRARVRSPYGLRLSASLRVIGLLARVHAIGLNSWTGTEGSPVSSLNCDGWQRLNLESFSRCRRRQRETDVLGRAMALPSPPMGRGRVQAGLVAAGSPTGVRRAYRGV